VRFPAVAALALGLFAASLSLAGCRAGYATEPYVSERVMLGTKVTIRAYGDAGRAEAAVEGAFNRMRDVEKQTNNYSSRSAISQVNDRTGGWRRTPPLIGRAIREALGGARLSDGAYDPTLWPVWRLWGFSGEERVPRSAELERALSLTGWRKVKMRYEARQVFLDEGMGLDLSGMAKGMAVESAADHLAGRLRHGLVTAGSTTAVFGGKPDGSPWRIGIEHPRKPGELIGIVKMKKGTMSTSGDYQTYFIRDGVRYHHIVDPKTGTPARGTMSATVVGEIDATTSDMLSTGLFVMGFEKAKRFVERHPRLGIVFVTADGRVRTAGNLRGKVASLKTKI